MKKKTERLYVNKNTIRILNAVEIKRAAGGGESGSANTSGPCPPTKNGDGSGCITAL